MNNSYSNSRHLLHLLAFRIQPLSCLRLEHFKAILLGNVLSGIPRKDGRTITFFIHKIYGKAFIQQTMIPLEDIQQRIVELEVEHRDLDAVIDLLTRDVLHDELQLRRLKKRKLQLKDHITVLRMQLIPDVPA